MTAQRLTSDAAAILRAAVAAADPAPAVAAGVAAMAISPTDVVHVVAVGKAALPMMDAALAALPARPSSCLAVTPRPAPLSLPDYEVIEASHPVPDASSLLAGRSIAALLSRAAPGDRVLVLISGGASALAVLPVAGVSLDDYAALVRTMLDRGADIVQLNTVRQHIDLLKAGGMARMARARFDGLIISDVIGNRLDIIASGPLTTASSTPADALRVLDALDVPAERIRAALAQPRSDNQEPVTNAHARIVLDNAAALAGARRMAQSLGYSTHTLHDPVCGEARIAAAAFVEQIESLAARSTTPVCLLGGGETTVTVNGRGTGGRNQEFTLAAALHLRTGIAVGSIGTDGIDGSTEAAGAVADALSLARARSAGLDPARFLDDNDSHTILRQADALITTGPTGTNVMDVMAGLALPS